MTGGFPQRAPEPVRNELDGTVYGPSVQARDVHGDIHVHQLAWRPPPPSQLPSPIGLTGRDRDLAAVDAARASRVIVITGPPGIGKTALAVGWGHRVRADFPDGVLFEDLHGYAPDGPASPAHVLGRFVRAFGVAPQQVPAELSELTAMYRSLVVDKRILVVLDDALTAAQVTPLIPPSVTSVTLVTSRWRLGGLTASGARVIHLGDLGSGAALELLTRVLGEERVAAEHRAAADLVNLCGRVPLAVCVAGARLAARSRWPITEMVDAMAGERRRLAALSLEDGLAVRSVLDVSYRALDADAARMYRTMGLYPGLRFDSGVAAAAAAVPRAEAKQLLGILTDANLLDDVEGGRYRFHDLTRLHAAEMAEQEDLDEVRDAIVRRVLGWFLATVTGAGRMVTPYRAGPAGDVPDAPAEPARFSDADSALEWLDGELPEVMAAMKFAIGQGRPAMAWRLSDAMWPLFLYRGRYLERLEFDQLGLEAARLAGDAAGEGKMLSRIGLAFIDLGQHESADDYCRQALALWERLGDDRRVGGALRRLGLLAAARERPAESIDWFTRALRIYRRIDAGRKIGLTLSDLGDLLTREGRTEEAIGRLEEAGPLLEAVPDPYNLARLSMRLGKAYQRTGNLKAAAGHLQHALGSMRDIASPRGEAEALVSLAELAERSGVPGEALRRYADAEKILFRLGSPRAERVRERRELLGGGGGR